MTISAIRANRFWLGILILAAMIGALTMPGRAQAQNAQVQAWLENPRPDFQDGHGVDVAIFGNIALVGASMEDGDATGANPLAEAGAAHIFERQPNGTWQLVQTLVASDRQAGQRFGSFVDLVNDWTLAVSAPSTRVQNLANAGAVYFFTKDATGTWVEAQKVVSPNPQVGGIFGWGLSLTSAGDTAVIGAPREHAAGNPIQSGMVYVFRRALPNPATHWQLDQTIPPPAPELHAQFGDRVLARYNEIFIGTPSQDVSANGSVASNAGAVYRYFDPTYGSAPFALTHAIEAADRSAGDQFGRRLAYNGTVLAVGSPHNQRDASGGGTLMTNSGAVYLFNAATNFTQTQKITLDSVAGHQRTAGDSFGFGLAMNQHSGNSEHLLIGAPNERHDVVEGTGMIPFAGSIYHFEINNSTATAAFQQKLVATQAAPNISATDRSYQSVFGYSIDIDQGSANQPVALTGSYKKIINGVPTIGRVYVLDGF